MFVQYSPTTLLWQRLHWQLSQQQLADLQAHHLHMHDRPLLITAFQLIVSSAPCWFWLKHFYPMISCMDVLYSVMAYVQTGQHQVT